MRASVKFLLPLLLLSGCGTTTLYTGQLSATDSAGKVQPFVLYWNTTENLFGSRKASPVTLLPCYPRTLQFEEQPAPSSAGTPTWIVFRGEAGLDQPVASLPQLGEGLCGRILTKNTLAELSAPEIEMTISCEAGAGDELSHPSPYLKAQVAPYKIEIKQQESDDLLRDTPTRAQCN